MGYPLIGVYLGKVSLFAIKQTISLLYFPINPSDIVVSNKNVINRIFDWFFSYCMNCIEPILAIKSKTSFFRHGFDQTTKQSLIKLGVGMIVGVLLMGISTYYIRLFIDLFQSVYGGYANMFIYLIGIVCLIPIIVYGVSIGLKKIRHPVITASVLSSKSIQ